MSNGQLIIYGCILITDEYSLLLIPLSPHVTKRYGVFALSFSQIAANSESVPQRGFDTSVRQLLMPAQCSFAAPRGIAVTCKFSVLVEIELVVVPFLSGHMAKHVDFCSQ
ncbi:hypothetical protein [Shewanella dokdonensis]|uniref:Uncharacterized protein n=1 Tax=Shewanella dokdonensis TaxID=712036 RepID=A0ABX8DIN0_9GAMM|nr:hypothetical protein [Shewanella dokdonensis]MCL1075651.1 hypothetical protein [Shewanella dokdonensis]QVK24648.1 hypothetical protein KHX94_09660 [Shewanella dokdonensis]